MIYIMNRSTDPFFNMALEEYLLTAEKYQRDIFLLWQNDRTIVVGRHQNTLEEINSEYVKENSIRVVRRLSGGGAVYHDGGNLNFTFIKRNVNRQDINFNDFAQPVIAALAKFGLPVDFSGRNDLTVGGKKFSGNAQYYTSKGLLHHGTLLFDSDFGVLGKCLNVKEHKYISKGVKSVQSRVVNIKQYLSEEYSLEDLKEQLIATVFDRSQQKVTRVELDADDRKAVENLVVNRYHTWDWNYGESPRYNFRQEKILPGGTVAAYLDIVDGRIVHCTIHGDFFTFADIGEVARALVGVRHEEKAIREVLAEMQAEKYFYQIGLDDLTACFVE
ncbi:MAG: lipoate--protein ligase [Firmicutes bacterium]|nr:lipoate--protein ligase [Bacillota bacterium]